MNIIDDNGQELNADVIIGYEDNLLGLFLQSSNGLKESRRNPDYFEALELILKRFHHFRVEKIRVFVSSKRLSSWKKEDREIFLNNKEQISLMRDYVQLRKSICNAQAKIKEDPNSKGGNSTKKIFIYAENLDENHLHKLLQNKQNYGYKIGADSDFFLEEDFKEVLFIEGREVFGIHKRKERNRKLVELAKKERFKIDNKLSCQICSFSFVDFYGKIGENFIEAHHILPISELLEETITKISDLIMVCPNCHRMLHRTRPFLTPEELRIKINKTREK